MTEEDSCDASVSENSSTALDLAIGKNRRRVLPLLLRAGGHYQRMPRFFGPEFSYMFEVTNAGGFRRFEKQHRDIFVKILAPKLEDRIPKDVVPLIVTYWVHLGFWVHTRTSAHAH